MTCFGERDANPADRMEVFSVHAQRGLALAIPVINQEKSTSQAAAATSAQAQNEHRGPRAACSQDSLEPYLLAELILDETGHPQT